MDRWPQTNYCPLWALIYSDRGDLCDHWGLGLFWSKWLRFSSVCCILAQWSGSESHSVMSDTLQTHGLYRPWNSPGQNIGVGSLSLLQGIFPIQELNQGLLHCRQILYQLSYQGSPSLLANSYLFPVFSFTHPYLRWPSLLLILFTRDILFFITKVLREKLCWYKLFFFNKEKT